MQNLSNFLSEAVIEADSLRQAFDNLFGSVQGLRNLFGALAADIVQVISRMIALKIVSASISLLGGLSEGGQIVDATGGAASGGLLRGPGTGTSDSILARVSAGEDVVRAAAVAKYGSNFLHRLNAGAIPREVTDLRRFATGGFVGTEVGTASAETKEFQGTLTVGLGEGLVVDQMDTPAGEKLILGHNDGGSFHLKSRLRQPSVEGSRGPAPR